MYLCEATSLLEKYNQNIDSIIIYDKSFNVDEFLKFFENMMEISDKIDGIHFIVSSSRRKAMLCILEEKYYKINSYSEVDIKLQEIENEAKKRFTFNNRDKRKFNSPQTIHPKQPFKHYGDNKYEFHYYILAVKNILSMPEIHIYDKNALENLKNIYEKIRE
jgi:hypothetical protein